MTREEIKALFPDATDEQISSMLNLHHKEMDARKRDNSDAAEKTAKIDEQAATIDELRKQVESLTASYSAAKKASNTTAAIAKLVKAGMDEELAKSIAGTTVTDDEKATGTAIDTIVSAYAAQEKTRQDALAAAQLRGMPKPQAGGTGEKSGASSAAEYGKRLGEKVANRKNSGTLEEFRN